MSALICLAGCGSNEDLNAYQGLSAAQIYSLSQENIAKNDYKVAIEDLEALEARYPYGSYAIQGQLALIESYYKNEKYVAALASVDRFIRMNPRHPLVVRALYLKGLVLYKQAFTFAYKHFPLDRSIRDPRVIQQAFNTFQTIVKKYSQSKYIAESRQKMHDLHNMLGNHELHVAKYYMKRKAYIAVVNRAQGILHNFKNTPALKPALELLMQAYNELNMPKLEKKAQALLAKHK